MHLFDAGGHGVDFIFRYCNKHMEVVEGIPVEEMDLSLFDMKDEDFTICISVVATK